MKKNYFLFCLFFMIIQAQAQTLYTITTSTATYADLTSPISVNNGQVWDFDDFGPYQVPFSFKVAGQVITHFAFQDDNFIFLTGLNEDTDDFYYLLASGIYIQDKNFNEGVSQSPIGYKVEGNAGSRILKMQVKNAGSEDEALTLQTNNLFLNFQVWIYEGTNVIEYRYGNTNITASNMSVIEDGIQMGIVSMNEVYGCALYGNPASPTVAEFFNGQQVDPNIDYVMTTYPTNGRVYKFTPSTSAATEEFNKIQFRIYPNPVTESLRISLENMDSTDYVITDLTGKIIRKGKFTDLENTVDVTDVNSGMYFIKIGNTTKKFLKK